MKLTRVKDQPSTIDVLRREMDHFFDDLVPYSWSKENGGKAISTWNPSTDITEDDNEYIIKLDIPGMEKKDISVNFHDGRVTITGERKLEEKEEKKDFIRRERFYGSFYRSFTLPEKVKEEKIEASFKEGVLKLSLPKAEVVKPKSITVK
ncbi:MAG: Hsp20/alpha crystallin family protein [Balneolaceae bacterium]|nr:Hsp20/alpha crystallin family protein [Balneolaceae bacterium]MCH8548156.1 Hsp20/alpha crystallin family protein [Balneolaceae bacterium]